MFLCKSFLFLTITHFLLEPRSSGGNPLLNVGADLYNIKRMIEKCDELIKRTTEIDYSKEKFLYETVEFTDRLLSSLNIIRDKCLIEIDFYKNNRSTYELLQKFILLIFNIFY